MKFFRNIGITGVFAALVSLALLALAVVFARERVIYADTAVYMDMMIEARGFFIPTNRFISALTQVLPLLGVYLGLSLPVLIGLYSVSAVLLPVIGSAICLFVFRRKEVALALLLFYLLMNSWLFYYPVSEFQMGLCLLFIYHAYALHYFRPEANRRVWLFVVLTCLLIVTITFSHPLAVAVVFAWAVWCIADKAFARPKWLAFPLLVSALSAWVRDHFFKAFVGEVAYDEQKKEGVQNFLKPVAEYFDSVLFDTYTKTFLDHYFVAIVCFLLVTGYFIWYRKWWLAVLFPGLLFGFWLLVTVSFPNEHYGAYMEHLYQPVTFFLALVFGRYVFLIIRSEALRFSFLCLASAIMLVKIYNNHRYFERRLTWYGNYIHLMHEKKIKKAALNPKYIYEGQKYEYWAARYETLLLSSLADPDSSAYFLVDWSPETIHRPVPPDDTLNSFYYHLDNLKPFVYFDSVATATELEALQYAVDE